MNPKNHSWTTQDLEVLTYMYPRHTINEIADHFDLSYDSVRYALRWYNIVQKGLKKAGRPRKAVAHK